MNNSRKELFYQTKKKYILEAAFELFKEKGVEDTGMGEIAKASDYTRASIYKYFKSKDDICLQVVLEYGRASEAQIAAMAKEESPLNKVRAWGEALYHYGKAHPHYIEIMAYLDYRGLRPDRISPEAYANYDTENLEMVKIFREIFHQGVVDGTIDSTLDMDISISQYSYTLRRIIDRSIKSTYSFSDINSDEYFAHYLNLFLKALAVGN